MTDYYPCLYGKCQWTMIPTRGDGDYTCPACGGKHELVNGEWRRRRSKRMVAIKGNVPPESGGC